MPEWIGTDVGLWVFTSLFVIAGLYLSVRGWRGHRAKGSPRCRKCYYSMVAATSLTCPECGKPHRKKNDLLRPRRYFKRFVLGVMVLTLGLYVAFWPDVWQRREREEKWYIAAIPTTALILALPWHHDYEMLDLVNERMYGSYERPPYIYSDSSTRDEAAGEFFNETVMFRVNGELYPWQVRLLIQQAETLIHNRGADDDEEVWYAVRWLVCAAHSDERAIDGLLNAMELKNGPDLRADVVLGLGLLPARDEQIVDILIELLDDEEMSVVGTAAMALSVRGDERFRAAPKLVEIVKGSVGESFEKYLYVRNHGRWADNAADNARKTLRSFGEMAVPLVLDELEQFDPWDDSEARILWWEIYLEMEDDGLAALGRVGNWLQRPRGNVDSFNSALAIGWRYDELLKRYGHHVVLLQADHIIQLDASKNDDLHHGLTRGLRMMTPKERNESTYAPVSIARWCSNETDKYWRTIVPMLVKYITRYDPHANIDQIHELLRLLVAIGPDARAAVEPLGKWLDDANVTGQFSLRKVYGDLKKAVAD